MTQERFSNLTVLNSHKERTAKFAFTIPPPPAPNTSIEVVTGPCTLKTAPQALLRVLTLTMLISNNILHWTKPARKPIEHNQGWASMMNIISTGKRQETSPSTKGNPDSLFVSRTDFVTCVNIENIWGEI